MPCHVDAVVIGRNEGDNLHRCLAALRGQVRRVIYVDSGSTDGSQQMAVDMGAELVELDRDTPFTAARARNAGLAALAQDPPDFVQFLDGDCEMDGAWIATALAAFASHPAAVVVCGRRRERFPQASRYNKVTDREWDSPIGKAKACGGDALMRYGAVQAVGGYRANLIAGEEPELCLRLARQGGEIWRIDAEMTMHDAKIHRFSQWWRRMVRSGYAYAAGAALYGRAPERHWLKERNRAVLWALVLPVLALLAGLIHPLGFALALIYPVQIIRLAARGGFTAEAWNWATLSLLTRFAEARGILSYWLDQRRGRFRGLIEYRS